MKKIFFAQKMGFSDKCITFATKISERHEKNDFEPH